MQSGITFESGEVLLVPFPFTDLSQTKRRPVLVISNSRHNAKSNDFVCCGITSNLSNRPDSILLNTVDMSEGALPFRSRIKYDKIFTLEKGLAIKRLGKINARLMDQVRGALASLFS